MNLLSSIRFSSAFVRFARFCFSHEKYVLFRSHFFYVYIHTNQTVTHWTNVFQKIFCKKVQSYFEMSLSLFLHKIIKQNFYQYVTAYLSWILINKIFWTKEPILLRGEGKNVRKRTETTKNGYYVNSLLTDQLVER